MKELELLYHKDTNTTYLMEDGTCTMSYKGYRKLRCSCGQGWVFPKIVKECPV